MFRQGLSDLMKPKSEMSKLRTREMDSKIKKIQKSFIPDVNHQILSMSAYQKRDIKKMEDNDGNQDAPPSIFDEIIGTVKVNTDLTLADCFRRKEKITSKK